MADVRQAWMGWKASTRQLWWSVAFAALNAVTSRGNAAREMAVIEAKSVADLKRAGFRVFGYDVITDDWTEIWGDHKAQEPSGIDWKKTDWTPATIYGRELRCVAMNAPTVGLAYG